VQELQRKDTQLSTQVANAGAGATAEDKQALSDVKVQLNEKQAELAETVKKINDAMSGMSKPASEGLEETYLLMRMGSTFIGFRWSFGRLF
jgi:hypothetical protein